MLEFEEPKALSSPLHNFSHVVAERGQVRE